MSAGLDQTAVIALHGWVTRSRAALGDRAVSVAVYEGRTVVGELASVEAEHVVSLVSDVAILAGKSWAGRVSIRDAQGAELLAVPVRLDRAPLSQLAPTGPVEPESVRDGGKALADALRASTQHTHAMAGLLIQTVKSFGEGAAAMMTANERALAAMAERVMRAEQERERLESVTRDALDAAREASESEERAQKNSKDVVSIARVAFGPKVDTLIQGALAAMPKQLNGAEVAPAPEGTQKTDDAP